MGKIIDTLINRFDGGMVNDPRDPRSNVATALQHFDAFTDKYRLTPYRSAESGDSATSTNMIANYCYDGTTVYGLGVKSGDTDASILTRTAPFTDATWTAFQNIDGNPRVAADTPFFTYYKKTGKIYGVQGGQYVWAVTISPTSAANQEADLTAYATVSNGIVHSKDDILYVGHNNKIAKLDGSNPWVIAALTLPSNLAITSICEYGNYLAIGCRNLSGLKSVVFLWDRDSSVTTLSEGIDWGEGNLSVLEELEGYLVGVSFVGTTGSYSFKNRTVFRRYSGGSAVKFAEFTGFSQAPSIQSALFKQKVNNRVMFPASISIGTTAYFGIWSIIKSESGEFVVALDRLYTTAYSGSLDLYGFILLGDYLFASYTINSTWYMDKTDNDANYTASSMYQSPIFNLGESRVTKKLIGVTVMTEPMPADGQIVLKYRKDEETSYTTIFTNTTNDSISHSAINIESSGATLPTYKEMQFQIISTGGAVVTGLKFRSEVIDNDAY